MTDTEPIYCAEQIAVPEQLTVVLKNYTKEVLRQQPADLIAFSATYFGELAQAAKGVSSITPPSAAQLHKAYASLAPKQQASISELQAACAAAGIGAAVLPQVLQASAVATTGTIAVPEALLLLLTTGCDSFAAVVGGVFEVFGEQLAVPLFTRLLALLGSRDRDNLSVGLLEEVAGALEGQESVSYEGLAVVPSLWAKLAAH